MAVTVKEKKEFIRWFLKRHKLKRRECVWILNYLLGHEHLLQNVHFTKSIANCPRSIGISTEETGYTAPFVYYKNGGKSQDVEKAFLDLRLQPDEKMYVAIYYPNRETCSYYSSVFEENPYSPDYKIVISDEISDETESLMDEIIRVASRTSLLNEIDKALDNGDKERF